MVEVLVVSVRLDVEIIAAVVLKFAVSVPYSVCVSPDVTIDLFMDMLTDLVLGFLPGIGIGVLVDVNTVNAKGFAVPMNSFELSVSIVEGFGRSAAFDCRPLSLLDCGHALQTWMPSCHV